ncbi:hypothetical protein LguiB_013962 [Lonicera macranthoides]
MIWREMFSIFFSFCTEKFSYPITQRIGFHEKTEKVLKHLTQSSSLFPTSHKN